MKITTEDFLAAFHSISGTTIGERRKNLFILLNKTKSSEIMEVDFSAIQPRTSLESKFKIDTLIYFKQVALLVEVLKSENPALIDRVLRNSSWFFEAAFENVTADQFVTLLLPHICMKAKLKIINKLAVHLKSAQKGDEYFKAVEATYGLHLASKLLPCCSLDLIKQCLTVHKTKLTPRQLKMIVERYPRHTEEILEMVRAKIGGFSDEHQEMFQQLAQRDFVKYLKLREKFRLKYKIGWRITEKFVKRHKDYIINNPSKYCDILKKKQVVKTLQKDFQEFYAKFFPVSVDDFEDSFREIFNIFELLPKKRQQVGVLFEAFQRAYGISLWQRPDYLKLKLLELTAPNDRPELKMELKPKSISEDIWYCFYKPDVSIPFLKKRISLSSDIPTRIILVTYLVDTCKFNNDREALAAVCKYMVTKHRNDHVSVRGKFLRAIQSRFELMELDEAHWTAINELTSIFKLNKESFYLADEFLAAYVYFRLEHDLPIKEQLTEIVKERYDVLNLLKKYPKYQKRCMLEGYEVMKELKVTGYMEPDSLRFCKSLIQWNEKNPKDTISLFSYPEIMEDLNAELSKEKYGSRYTDIIWHLLKHHFERPETKEILKKVLSVKPGSVMDGLLRWLVRFHPAIVGDNLPQITEHVIKQVSYRDDYFIWIFLKNYTHLGFPEKMVPICLTHKDDEGAIIGLVYLMQIDQLLKFVEPYRPTNLRAESNTEEGRKLYEIQQLVAKSLSKAQPLAAILDAVLTFCKGDYLKLILSTLYSVLDTTNENKLTPFLTNITDSAVSVRKHSMHLTFRLMGKKQIFDTLSKFMAKEKNSSVRKFLFKGIFNYFSKNPDSQSWELLKANVAGIDVEDKEALDILLETSKIPSQFHVPYLMFTWDFLERLPDGKDRSSQKNSLLRLVTPEIIRSLPEEFCEGILAKYFLKNVAEGLTFFQSEIHVFACKFIIYANRPQQVARLEKCFEALKSFVAARQANRDSKQEGRNFAANFLKEFSLQFIKHGCRDKDIMQTFADQWNQAFQPIQSFKEYLYLSFVLIHIQRFGMDEIANRVATFFDHVVSKYGVTSIDLFCSSFLFFQSYFFEQITVPEGEFAKVNLIERIMKSPSVPRCLLAVLLLMRLGECSEERKSAKCESLIGSLQANREPIVQIYLSSYLGGETTLNYK